MAGVRIEPAASRSETRKPLPKLPAHPLAAFVASLPSSWQRLVRCESLNDGSWRQSSSSHARGVFQFLPSSWRMVGGSGDPAAASYAEQWMRALRLFRLQGWAGWTCSRIVGLR